ncbi:hypothetical protein ACTFIW_012230 [Dictyostelium discoideum]
MKLISYKLIYCFIAIFSLVLYLTITLNHLNTNISDQHKTSSSNISPLSSSSSYYYSFIIDYLFYRVKGGDNNNNKIDKNSVTGIKGNINNSSNLIKQQEHQNNNNNNNNNKMTKTIKLLTYNVFIRPPGIKNNENDWKDERIECLISDSLSPHINYNKGSKSAQGIPNTVYSVDKTSFPYIPYFSPWKYPVYGKLMEVTGMNKKAKSPPPPSSLKQQNLHNNSSDYQSIAPSKSILAQYDIICLQELFSAFSYRQRRFIEKAEQQGFQYYATSPSPPYLRSTFLVDGGLTVISKYPIVASDFFLYEQGVDSDMLSSKGVLYTKIKVVPTGSSNDDENFIHLFTTHMQASYAPKSDGSKTVKASATQDQASNYKNDNIRLVQLSQLREFIFEKTFKDKSIIILAGDLNVNGRVSKDDPKDGESYLQMLELLSNTDQRDLPTGKKIFTIQDLLRDDFNGEHPPTVGDIKFLKDKKQEIPLETVLTNPNDFGCMKRLDYILLFNREFETSIDGVELNFKVPSPTQPSKHSQQHSSISPLKGSTKVDPFFIQGFPFTQLSDHYGVSTILQINK